MMKLNALVLSVLCGVAVSYALTLPSLPTCPNFLKNLVATCNLTGPLDLNNLLSSYPSSSLECLANTVLGELGLTVNSTEYYAQNYISALVGAGLSLPTVQSCVAKVKGVVGLGGIDLLGCQLDLVGAVDLCLLQNQLYGCISL